MTNPLAETHVELSINIFDQTQHALVRKHLTVDRLIADILREFAQELDLNRRYILLLDGRQLDPEVPVGDLQLDPDTALTFGYYEPVRPAGASQPRATQSMTAATLPSQPEKARTALLRERQSGQAFRLNPQNTIIGRGGSGATEQIDIDLSPFPEGRTVSRPHARITAQGDAYQLEPLKDQRPVYINGDEVPFGKSRRLAPGDILGIGRIELTFELA